MRCKNDLAMHYFGASNELCFQQMMEYYLPAVCSATVNMNRVLE